MRLLTSTLIVLILVSSCKEKSEYPGFSVTQTGLNYKIHTIGEPNSHLIDSQMVWLDYEVTDIHTSVIQSKSDTYLLYRSNVLDTGLMEFLSRLVIGDSASMLQLDELGHKNERSINILVKGQLPYNQWEFYAKYGSFFDPNQIKNVEAGTLQSVLNEYVSDSIEVYNGVFIIREVTGNGEFPITDEVAVFHFEGFTSDHKLFDSTRKRKKPFSYKLGVQDQVIKGLDFAVRRMKKGERATVIIPSFLAFGSSGSSNGLVKSNQPLIYQVELIDVISDL